MPIFVPHSKLAILLGTRVVRSDATTVRDLIKEVKSQLSTEDWERVRRANLLVNGRNIHFMDGLDTTLETDDEVWMVVPSAGG